MVDVDRYEFTRVLVMRNGVPLGVVDFHGCPGIIRPEQLARAISDRFWPDLARDEVYVRLAGRSIPSERRRSRANRADEPFISVVVCTRDRHESIRGTLESLKALHYHNFEVLIIDNAPSGPGTRDLLRKYPFRYVLEPRPGLDWARNRGIAEAKGDIIAFIDDDAYADTGWLKGIAEGFRDPETMCVTGLVFPAELETYAQELFEIAYGGFGRGFEPLVYQPGALRKYQTCWPSIGTGANMAFRREAFDRVGVFDVAFDVGTPTGGCGDLDMFRRLMRAGCRIEYRPEALVYHCHRRSMDELRRQLYGYGKSFIALQTKAFLSDPRSRLLILRYLFGPYLRWNAGRVVRRLCHRERMPMSLLLVEMWGALHGPIAYLRSRRHARKVEASFASDGYVTRYGSAMASLVRRIEITDGLTDIPLPSGHSGLFALITYRGSTLGDIWIKTHQKTIPADWLRQQIESRFTDRILRLQVEEAVIPPKERPAPESLPSIAVVVPVTRPDDHLRRCLDSLSKLAYPKKEVIVVDNGVDCEETYALCREFGVRYVREKKRGANFARNAGIRAADAEIIAFTDDDVVVDPEWLNAIEGAFRLNPAIACVTGLIMPYELETRAQELFEKWGDGGMRRGYERRIYDKTNLDPVSSGRIGVGGNMAFRASVLGVIGGLDEALCPGTPARCGEEPDMFYRLLTRGYKICYEPGALVWHTHRRSMEEYRRQLECYNTGTYAFLTKALLEYREPRAFLIGCAWFRHHHLPDLIRGLTGRGRVPLSLTLSEIAGVLRGPIGYFKAKAYVSQVRLQEGTERRGLAKGEGGRDAGFLHRASALAGRVYAGRRLQRSA